MQIVLFLERKRRRLSQYQLAKMIGMSESSYRAKENDEQQFEMAEMFAISDIFNKTISEIFSPRKYTKRVLE